MIRHPRYTGSSHRGRATRTKLRMGNDIRRLLARILPGIRATVRQVAQEFRQSVYVKSSHPKLKHDWDLWDRLFELAPGMRGLDAGCGAGARDVLHAWSLGYDVTGVDSIEENIQAARDLHPEIADRVLVADLERPLPFPDETFDFVACNAVIQHIAPEIGYATVLPELVRILRDGGALQIMFKNGNGVVTVFDRDYGTEHSFQL